MSNNNEERLQKYIEKAMENIEIDREKADFLLNDVIEEIKKRKMEYRDLGPVAAKYLESLTRCNEQLVRVVSLLIPKTKNNNTEDTSLSSEDKEYLFDTLQNNQKTENVVKINKKGK